MPPLNRFTRSALAICLGQVICATPLHAASILVTGLDDADNPSNGDCTLREAVASANANVAIDDCDAGDVGADSIYLSIGSTINLSQAEPLLISEGLSIVGGNATINANNNERHFEINSTEAVAIDAVNLIGGSSTDYGGAILIESGSDVTIENSQFTGNIAAENGGAINIDNASLTISKSAFTDNSASSDGGALYATNSAGLTITDASFSGNYAGDYGGAIYTRNTVTLVANGSTFEGNTAGLGGGGLYAYNFSDVTITNSSLTKNKALGEADTYNHGGAISVGLSSSLTLVNSTVTRNFTANEGGGVSAYKDATLSLFNNIISGNSAAVAGHEVFLNQLTGVSYGYINSALSGNNLLGSSRFTTSESLGAMVAQASDIIATKDGASPTSLSKIVLPIADNGGFTRTMALPLNSLAINAASEIPPIGIAVPLSDQRGISRADFDIGAVERIPTDPKSDDSCFIVKTATGTVTTFCL